MHAVQGASEGEMKRLAPPTDQPQSREGASAA